MKAREVTRVTSPERAGAHLLLAGEPFAAEALGVADHRVEFCASLMILSTRADCARSVASGFSISSGMPRSAAARIGSTCRCSSVAMMAQVTSGRAQQLDVALRDEIGADLRRDLAGAVRVLLGERRSISPPDGAFATSPRNSPTRPPPMIASPSSLACCLHVFSPARIFCLNSAICEIVWLVSGRSTGSLRSAERSAAE